MDKFLRKNFLAIWCLFAVIFAVAKGLTIFQKKPTPTATLTTPPIDSTQYWRQPESSHFVIEISKDSLKILGEASLSFQKIYFNTSSQVRSDSSDKEAIITLFLNKTENIGNSHTMNSVFSPSNVSLFTHAQKAVSSFQNDAGITFGQINLVGMSYRFEGKNYQSKQATTLNRTWLEDELWTRIRLDTNSLPKGDFELIPSLTFCQAKYLLPKPFKAIAKIFTISGIENKSNVLRIYELTYPDLKRSLKISFEENFPHKIVGWEESDGQQTLKASFEKTNKPIRGIN